MFAGVAVGMLGSCAASRPPVGDSTSFLVDAVPDWLIPRMRDDYMGKRFLQPEHATLPVEHDKHGDYLPEPRWWRWPTGGS